MLASITMRAITYTSESLTVNCRGGTLWTIPMSQAPTPNILNQASVFFWTQGFILEPQLPSPQMGTSCLSSLWVWNWDHRDVKPSPTKGPVFKKGPEVILLDILAWEHVVHFYSNPKRSDCFSLNRKYEFVLFNSWVLIRKHTALI